METETLDADEVQRLAAVRIAPFVQLGGAARVHRPLLAELAAMGLLAPFFPKEFGGTGDGSFSATLLSSCREGLARVSTEASTALAIQIGGIYVAVRHAGDDARRQWIPPVVRGEAVAAVALTEPEVGSDLAAMAMPAVRAPGGWRLSGTKVWIMKAPEADIYTVFARTSGTKGPRGITAFLVPGDSPGLSGEAIEAMWPDRVGRLFFDGVFVPDSHVIGNVDDGFRLGMGIFDVFRPSVGAHVVGLSQAALDASVRYAKQRRAFGQEIGKFQAVSHLLADMAARLEAARLLVYHAAGAYDSGLATRQTQSSSSMAKLFATETAQFVVDSALQIHGAVALERGHLLEQLYREVRASRIYEGTSEIQREIIARHLLGEG